MRSYEPARIAVIHVPARTDVAAAAPELGGIEPKAGNHGKGVAASGVNREPASASAFAVTHQIARRQRRIQKSGMMKRVRNRSRTIIPAIVERAVATAPDIRSSGNRIDRPNGMLHPI